MKFFKKVVSFSTKNGDVLALYSPKFKKKKGKIFIEGIIPRYATNNDWAKGKISAILWDEVIDYMIFNSKIAYKNSIKKSE